MTQVFDLPIVVCGELRWPTGDDTITLEYTDGVAVRLPRLGAADLDAIVSNRERLDDIPFSEVTRYLSAAGARWADHADPLRREALELACTLTGYSEPMLARDYWLVGDYLMFRNNYYDLLDAELGDHRLTDEWVRNQVARVRAFPRGRVLHILVGNVPMAGIYSVVRSLVTRNQTVLKLPARDPVSALYFVRTLIEVNGAEHPLSRSLTAAYFGRDDDTTLDALTRASDLVCAWGQGSSLEAVKRRIPHSIPYLEFGPKRSCAVVYADEVDPRQAAMRIAHDVSVYDQEACFSPQRLYVIGDHRPLCAELARWFDVQQRCLPRGRVTPDADSHVLRTRLEAHYRGWEVVEGDGGWTLMVADAADAAIEHPLSRTLFVHPIASLEDVFPFVDDETQTIAVLPHSRALEVADAACARGAVRVCEAGMVSHFRQGFTHDGAYPLQQFVRLAHLDESLEVAFKYGDPRPIGELEELFFGAGLEGSAD